LARFKRKDKLGYHLYLNRPNTEEYREWLAEFGIDLSDKVNEWIEKELSRIRIDEQIRNSGIAISVNFSAVRMPPPPPPTPMEEEQSKMTLSELKESVRRFMRDHGDDKRMLKEAFSTFSDPYNKCKTAMWQLHQLEKTHAQSRDKWNEIWQATSAGQAELQRQQKLKKEEEEEEEEDE
jgi:hypothetical protein